MSKFISTDHLKSKLMNEYKRIILHRWIFDVDFPNFR